MIIDKISNIHQYSRLGIDTRAIVDFIAKYHSDNLTEGRYDIAGDDLFALVQRNETKDATACCPESHVRYIDLQLVINGFEMLLWDFADELDITQDRTPVQDIRFHKQRPEMARVILIKDMFILLYPQDAHTPCLHLEKPSEVEKIVFKIKMC